MRSLLFAVRSVSWYIASLRERREKPVPKSITLASDLDDALSRLAATTGRSKSSLVHEALRSFVATEEQFLAAVEEGKQALKESQVVDHAAVVAAFDRITTPR